MMKIKLAEKALGTEASILKNFHWGKASKQKQQVFAAVFVYHHSFFNSGL